MSLWPLSDRTTFALGAGGVYWYTRQRPSGMTFWLIVTALYIWNPANYSDEFSSLLSHGRQIFQSGNRALSTPLEVSE